jgi:transposase
MVQCPLKGPGTVKALMLQTEDWSFLRRLKLQEGKSDRWISKQFNISRKTVSKYTKEETPPKYKMTKPRQSPALEPYKQRILEILEADKKAPAKHHHTSKRIYERIKKEGYGGGESTVRNFIGKVRAQTCGSKMFVPLDFQPGKKAQVDFGEVYVCMNCSCSYLPFDTRTDACANSQKEQLLKLQCFVMRLCGSRRVFAMCLESANLPGFMEAHKQAFEFFGCRPKALVYDNLGLAVTKVLQGRERKLTNKFEELSGYYGFEHEFCQPGIEGAHQKGGVEGGIGYIRRNWFVPILHVKDLNELNDYLIKKCKEDMERTVDGQSCSIAEAWELEQPHMIALPARSFDACVSEPAQLDSYGMVRYDKNFYSVPDTALLKTLTVKAYWNRIEITDSVNQIAVHPRSYQSKERIFHRAHYYELLERRPGAVPHARPLLSEPLPKLYWQYYEQQRAANGLSHAGKEFIRILRLHDQYGEQEAVAALKKILEMGALDANLVQSLIVSGERTTVSLPPLDMSKHSQLADFEVLAVDLHHFSKLIGGIENDDREPAA